MAELSDYERRRLENIERNEAFLASLGLDSIKPVIEKPTKKKDIQERKKAAARQAQSEGPSRRSSRIAGIKTSVVHEEDEDEDKDGKDEDDAVDYDQMPSEPWQLDDAEFQVLVRLKQWRLLKCRELETEAYKIFQNRTLSEAVRRRRNVPTFGAEDIVAWTEIWGIGPGKTSSEPRGFAWDLRDELDRPEALELLKKSRLSGAHIQVKVCNIEADKIAIERVEKDLKAELGLITSLGSSSMHEKISQMHADIVESAFDARKVLSGESANWWVSSFGKTTHEVLWPRFRSAWNHETTSDRDMKRLQFLLLDPRGMVTIDHFKEFTSGHQGSIKATMRVLSSLKKLPENINQLSSGKGGGTSSPSPTRRPATAMDPSDMSPSRRRLLGIDKQASLAEI